MQVKEVKNISNDIVEVKLSNGLVYKVAPGEGLKNMALAEESIKDSRLQIVRDLGEIKGNK
jgi:hypothetical protein